MRSTHASRIMAATEARMHIDEPQADESAMQNGNTHTRRCLRRSAGATAAAVALFGYALCVEPRWIEVTRIEIPIDGLPADLEGFTVAQLSDLHLGPTTTASHIRRAVDMTNRLHPDLVVLTGDYVSGSAAFARPCADELASLSAPHGVSAILGNHDEWTDAQLIADRLRRVGIHVLRNEAQEIRSGVASLWLVGIDDPGVTGISWQRTLSREEFAARWAREREAFEELKAGIPPGDPAILLVHNPDFVETVSLQGISLALCGHTHGGQIRLPVAGPPLLPSIHGQKYAAGLAECQTIPVYVNRGVGVMGLPLRLLCRPEITLIRLRSA